MPVFRVQNLPDLTKLMHESRKRWLNGNWKKSLKLHPDDIEKTLEKIRIFDLWSNGLHSVEVANLLIPEIFVDAYASVHFACFGLYKYAGMCLRSELEMALRLVYFSTHPVEHEWWLKGKTAYKQILKGQHVWGSGYSYFENLENIQSFERACEDTKKLFGGEKKLNNLYHSLSQFIHTGARQFQTTPERFSPEYDIRKFKEWFGFAGNVQTYINIILSLSFSDKFTNIAVTERNKILNVGIGNYYKEKVREVLGI